MKHRLTIGLCKPPFLAPRARAATDSEASKPIDVYLIGGQSSANGQGYLKNLPKNFAQDARSLLFHSGRPHL